MDLLWSSSCVYYLIIGSSTEPALFHAGCRPSPQVCLRPALIFDLLVRKACPALTSDLLIRKARLALTSDLLVRKARPTLTSDHIGTNPIITSERPSNHIHQHDSKKLLSYVKRISIYI